MPEEARVDESENQDPWLGPRSGSIISAPRVAIWARRVPDRFFRLGTGLHFTADQDYAQQDLRHAGSIFPYETIPVSWRGSASVRALVVAIASDQKEDPMNRIAPRPRDIIEFVRNLLTRGATDMVLTDMLRAHQEILTIYNARLTSENVSVSGGALVLREVRWHLTQPF